MVDDRYGEGVLMPWPSLPIPIDEDLLRQLWPDHNQPDIARRLHCSVATLKRKAVELGLPPKRRFGDSKAKRARKPKPVVEVQPRSGPRMAPGLTLAQLMSGRA